VVKRAARRCTRRRRAGTAGRQGEQQRVDQRAVQRHVDDEDPCGQHPGYLDQKHREAPQPGLELGLGLPLSQPERDPAEFRLAAGGYHDPGT
jgi:hypothetical protein